MEPEKRDDGLSVRPGTQAGWTLPLTGVDRCLGLGHELSEAFSYRNGLLVGYCVRCEARVEIPWFRGGTMAVLAEAMATEAVALDQPQRSVLDDLAQVEGLLVEDLAVVGQVLALVRQAHEHVTRRRSEL